mmetsp:Transcript_10779/g.15393  ORF Transcript_10779/g.15393 Transcript_10779/m.15393 type:complete len:474 (+) Transcript_10779:170-1591(+)
MVQDVVKESVSVPEPKSEPPPAPKPPPTNVLNMGHWETNDTDETSNLDFGFGSFGTENDTPSVTETTMSNSTPADSAAKEAAAASVSPARPPPGLSIAGVSSVPANAVLVSELESKLEGTTLGSKPQEPAAAPEAKPALPQTNHPVPQVASLPQGIQNYNNAYGMGMYNYNAAAAAGNGFVGMHGAPVLAGGLVPPQKPQGALGAQANSGQTAAPQQHLPQGSLYGTPASAVSGGVSGANDSVGRGNDTSAPAPANAMPPGIPNTMPYNPALFYGQQPYQMGQPHGGVGYGYGYGAQFGGVAQGGFGYQQVMGQSGAYPYDDQQQQGNSGAYNKTNSGGYRGRNHNSGNQYQNQYNPPGYGGQPYNMGYNVDHFGNRGGYGPGSMDPYGMQQGGGNYGQSGLHSFQNDDDHHKGGKKGGRSNGSNLQQFQQQQQQQQPFGLQGGDTNTTTNAGGWSNQNGGGWGGAQSGWQGS